MTPEGKVASINGAGRSRLPFNGTFQGHALTELIPDSDWLAAAAGRSLEEAAPRRASGSLGERHWEALVAPLSGEDGAGGALCLLIDVTDREAKRERLESDHAALRNVLEHVPHSIFWKDRHGRFLGGNAAVARDVGVPAVEDLIGHTDHEFFPREMADFFVTCDREVMETGRPMVDVEEPQQRPDGSVAWLLTSKVPLRSEDGRTIGILGIYTDITERKRMEQDLARALEVAEAAVKARADFLANVSHELRTPLTLILGPVESLLEGLHGELTADVRRDLLVIRRQANRLLVMVNELLDLSRVDAGGTTLRVERLDLVEVARSLVEDAAGLAQRKGLALSFHSDVPEEWVALDRGMLEKILLNLVGNALKFTPRGGSIEVSLARCEWRGEPGVELAVRDTGPGIPRERQHLLFQRFQQLDASSTRRHEGAGIGLALVKDLTEVLGGDVRVESEAGRGATFRVRLPRRAPGAAVLPSPGEQKGAALESYLAAWDEERPGLPEIGDVAPGERLEGRVLVAEDNPDMQRYLAQVLSGADLVVRSNGREALEEARAHPPDVILADVMMPEMDGLELAQRVKADARLRSIPVVLLTARAETRSLVAGLESGADDYLAKPFRPAELRARVRAALRLRTLHRDLERRSEELSRTLDDLRRTQDELLQAGRAAAASTLVAGLAHELNNPLGIMLMASQGLVRRLPPGAPHSSAEVIERQARRCSRLVEAMLTFVEQRPSDGGHAEIAPILEQVAAMTAPEADRRRIRLDVEPPVDGLPPLALGRGELESVLLHLLSNALDASGPDQSVQVRARGVVLSGGRAGVEVTVRDEGPGIPPEIQERIFDPFFTTKPAGSGSGLGLALARRVVEKRKGEIRLASEVGQGTTVSVFLPAASTEPAR